MNKTQLLALIATREARKAEIGTAIAGATEVAELRSLQNELNSINSEIANYHSIVDGMPDETAPAAPAAPVAPGTEAQRSAEILAAEQRTQQLNPIAAIAVGAGAGTQDTPESRDATLKAKFEQRGADLKDKKPVTYSLREIQISRSITIDTAGLVVPSQFSNTLNPKFNEVSSIVDLVHAVPMNGGETYTKGFSKPMSADADYTTDGAQHKTTEPVNDYVTIAKTFLTSYAEISKQSSKLTNIDYQAQLGLTVRDALRKKMARQIMVGDGAAGHFTGIFNAPVNVIPVESDLSISKIDADTLDKIVFGYGGDEDVEAAAYLILSKADLAAFAAIRSTTGERLYKIITKGNVGTISSEDSFSVNYVLNSICPALTATATATGTYCMAYGVLQYYEMPLFSDITVEMSTDYKFGEGMVAYSGEAYAGGNVASYKGFTRIKKAAAV
jgi:HK97 family phage major capsid protein